MKYIKKISLTLSAIMLAMAVFSSCAANTNMPNTTISTTTNTTQQSTSVSADTPITPAFPTMEYEALAYGFTDSAPGINAKIEFDINILKEKSYIKAPPMHNRLHGTGINMTENIKKL